MLEIYVSTDVETDGPMVGKNSMLSLGSAAYTADKQLLGTFSANLDALPGATPDPKTMDWWTTQPAAWAASLSCGPPVRFRLLSTPPRDDAVTFGYGVLAYPDTDFHRADVTPLRAHSFPRPAGSTLGVRRQE